jgi:hypothetical protein
MSRSGNSVIQGFFAQGVAHLAARFSAAIVQPKRASPVVAPRPSPLAVKPTRPVQPYAAGNSSAFPLPDHLASFTQVGGQPLPAAVRQKMESFFGASFSDVRVHVGPHAPAIGALAFTQGTHIHFAPGQYNPSSAQGQQILGHELTHVVQQRAGRVRNPFGSGVAVVQDVALEAEAERLGRRAAASAGPVQPFTALVPRPRQGSGAVQPTTPVRLVFGARFPKVRAHVGPHASATGGAASTAGAGTARTALLPSHPFSASTSGTGARSAAQPCSFLLPAPERNSAWRQAQRFAAPGKADAVQGSLLSTLASPFKAIGNQVSRAYNWVRNRAPFDVTEGLAHGTAAGAYYLVTSYVTLPVTLTIIVGGAVYTFTYNLSGTLLDILSVGELPGASATGRALTRSGGHGLVSTLPRALITALAPQFSGPAFLIDAGLAYLYTMPMIWQEHRSIVRSRGEDWAPGSTEETALALGVYDAARGISFTAWARDHGAVTYRYFVPLIWSDWKAVMEKITQRADRIYVNIAGYQISGSSNNSDRPSIQDIMKNLKKYLKTKPIGYGTKAKKVPKHGFTNYEIAYLIDRELLGKVTWFSGHRQEKSPVEEIV